MSTGLVKWCSMCGQTKPVESFHKDRSNPDSLESNCKQCRRDKKRERKYGVDRFEYNRMFVDQGGACKICRRHQDCLKKALHIDHCHRTNKVRGLLCSNCNTFIGLASDSPKLLKRAIQYLQSAKMAEPLGAACAVKSSALLTKNQVQ